MGRKSFTSLIKIPIINQVDFESGASCHSDAKTANHFWEDFVTTTFFHAINRSLIATALLTLVASIANGQLIQAPTLPTEEGKLVNFWLGDAWDKGIGNNDKSVQVFKAAAPKDSDVNLAYAVNRLQHNRSTEALAAVGSAKAADSKNLDAIVLSIWIKVLRDDFDVALIEMQSFADTVQKSKFDRDKLDVAYRRMGRLLGYFNGPVAGQCNPDILARTTERLNEGLDNRQKMILTNQSDTVMAKYEQLLKDLSQEVHDSIIKNEASNKASKIALEKQNNVLEAQTDQIQQRRDNLEQEGEQKISAVAQQLPALEAQLQNALLEIDAVRSQIQFNRSALFFGQNNFQGSPNLANNFNRFQLQQNYLVLNSLRANANTIANAIAVEQNKINQIRGAYNTELKRLNKDIKKSANLQRRNSNKLVKIAAGPEPDAGKVKALNNRTSALSIYDPLPLEQYRADFLRQLP